MLQHRYYLYQTTFPINEYGVWLEISYMKRFFVTAVYRVTTQSNVILVEGEVTWQCYGPQSLRSGILPGNLAVQNTATRPRSILALGSIPDLV